MKKIFLLLIISTFFSCDWGNNDDVDDSISVLSQLFTECQKNLVTLSGGEYSVYTGTITQQISGVKNDMLEIEQYDITPSKVDNSWNSCYLGVLSNLVTVINLSESLGLYKYRGIARIMMANTLGLASDAWSDIPFSESIMSNPISFTPAYDTQDSIYQNIFSFLDAGIQDLQLYGIQQFPISDDLFFTGLTQKWISYAQFLKLRYTLHLSKRNGFDPAYSLLENSMFSNPGESFSLNFSTIESLNSPLYTFHNTVPQQIRAGAKLLNFLIENNDPRIPIFFKQVAPNQYVGSNPGEANEGASLPSDSIFSASSKVILGSYTEQKFIEAEIYFRKGMNTAANEAFSLAVESSLLDYGVFNDFWLQNYLDCVELSLETIINAKYVALYMQPEVWSDWRRTGFPTLEPSLGNTTGGLIPRRFPYPQSEYNYNPNNVPQNVSITDGVWWDI
jgi:hypothetical protein